MLDSRMRILIDPPLEFCGRRIAAAGITANMLTIIGFVFSLACFGALAFQFYGAALALLLTSRIFDGLDGATARHAGQGPTNLGGFLDIVSDMVFYSGFVFFFALGQPQTALAAAFLIFSFMGTSSSFLTYAIMAEKRGQKTAAQGRKSFFYLSGLTEGTETILAFVLICLFPAHFILIAVIFSALCWMTTAGRVLQAVRAFQN